MFMLQYYYTLSFLVSCVVVLFIFMFGSGKLCPVTPPSLSSFQQALTPSAK